MPNSGSHPRPTGSEYHGILLLKCTLKWLCLRGTKCILKLLCLNFLCTFKVFEHSDALQRASLLILMHHVNPSRNWYSHKAMHSCVVLCDFPGCTSLVIVSVWCATLTWMRHPNRDPWWPLWRVVQFSRSVMSDSLQPHESQHARPPYPSPTSGVYSNSCPSSRWCHPAVSSSVVPVSSCPQSLPASGSFAMSQLFASGGWSIGVSASASVLPMNTQHWSPLWWTGWISLQSKGLSRVFSNTTVQKHQFFGTQLSL